MGLVVALWVLAFVVYRGHSPARALPYAGMLFLHACAWLRTILRLPPEPQSIAPSREALKPLRSEHWSVPKPR